MIKINGIKTYAGGKGSSFHNIINEIRPHTTLIVPFLGNCGVIRNIKRLPGNTIIGVDASCEVINKWQNMLFDWIKLIHGCGIEYLDKLKYKDLADTVIYIDPPYPLSARKSTHKRYDNELSDQNHERLLNIALKLQCDVLISTYKNDLYKEMLSDWRVKTFGSATRQGSATEYLYMNFDNNDCVLHDYRFLGDDYIERERIRKKVNRWVANLQQMPVREKNAILDALTRGEL